jgi:hypothetical protein
MDDPPISSESKSRWMIQRANMDGLLHVSNVELSVMCGWFGEFLSFSKKTRKEFKFLRFFTYMKIKDVRTGFDFSRPRAPFKHSNSSSKNGFGSQYCFESLFTFKISSELIKMARECQADKYLRFPKNLGELWLWLLFIMEMDNSNNRWPLKEGDTGVPVRITRNRSGGQDRGKFLVWENDRFEWIPMTDSQNKNWENQPIGQSDVRLSLDVSRDGEVGKCSLFL